MAKASMKHRARENDKTRRRHTIAICIGWGVYFLLRLFRGRLLLFSTVVHAFVFFVMYYFFYYLMIFKPGTPKYSSQRELLDGGADLTIPGGLVEYSFDVVYLTLLVQVVCVWTPWIFAVYIIVPVYLIWHFRDSIRSIFSLVLGSSPDGEETDVERRRRERAERRQQRRESGRVQYKSVRK